MVKLDSFFLFTVYSTHLHGSGRLLWPIDILHELEPGGRVAKVQRFPAPIEGGATEVKPVVCVVEQTVDGEIAGVCDRLLVA